jgi:HEPN domain
VSWEPGRERVRQLIDAGEVDQVTPDLAIARRMLEDAGRHLTTASAAKAAGDLSGAYRLAYDALRKSAASLLEAQGLRATSRGGHLAVQNVVTAQFGATVRVFRSFGRIRRARNNFDYPSSDSPGPASEDIDDAIAVATQACEAAATILDQDVLTRW